MAPARRAVPAKGRPVARIARPLREFVDTEEAGGLVLLVATMVALAWANSPWASSYDSVWTTELRLTLGGLELSEDLRHWVNDGLMVLFFFVVGIEVKRELAVGELSSLRKALLPGLAAVGGMVVPAGLYLALNRGEASQGWGIPIATDIAFALGVLAVLPRVPQRLRVLLLTLAVVDDIGAILVIAVFYTDDLHLIALAVAGGTLGLVVALRALNVWWVPAYVLVGLVMWLATLLSGVHATIAGVALGLLTPARPLSRGELRRSPAPQDLEESDGVPPGRAAALRLRVAAAVPVTDRMVHILHPWTSFGVLPAFALANAGVSFGAGDISSALGSSVTLGIVLGLVVGKTVGITSFALLAERLGSQLPSGVHRIHIVGMAAVAGIGFTMSLFIGGLAFDDPEFTSQSKVAILAGSALAATLGTAILLRAGRRRS